MEPEPASASPPRAPSRRARVLVAWFRHHRRPLPWRSRRDPYRIWVAEVLLQQTRVRQALPYYERFVARFPSVRALAGASRSEVLKAWEGAGYYARARRLHDAARLLVRTNGGRLPRSAGSLERLPGVGRYIARAIASLAFGEPVVALEANGLRVAARWTRETGDLGTARVRARLAAVLAAELPTPDAGPFNEAVMELGETVCLPRAPRCPDCPVAFACRAYRELADPSRVPRRAPRRSRPHVRGAVVVLTDRGRWLVQRRPAGGLLGGLWEFPGGKIEPGEDPEHAARRELLEETRARVRGLADLGSVHHAYSHFTVELRVFQGRPGARRPATSSTRRWVTPAELERLPIPGATRKIVRRLEEPGGFLDGQAGPRVGVAPRRPGSGRAPGPEPAPGARGVPTERPGPPRGRRARGPGREP